LIVALFLPWYSVAGTDVTGWQAMTVDDVLIAIAALGALAALLVDAWPRLSGFAVAALSLGSIVGLVAVVLTIFRVADPAPAGDASLAAGAWLARKAAAAARERAELLPLPGERRGGEAGEGAG
jgi:hypothetical protein